MAYDWTIAQIQRFGDVFRKALPNGHLAILHSTAHIPVGNGPADYAPGGVMRAFDVIMSEYDINLHQNSCWQINGRLEKPYHRPPDQVGDPSPPYYLAAGTTRGPYFHVAFEFGLYEWVRSKTSAADVQKNRDYLKAQGCEWTG